MFDFGILMKCLFEIYDPALSIHLLILFVATLSLLFRLTPYYYLACIFPRPVDARLRRGGSEGARRVVPPWLRSYSLTFASTLYAASKALPSIP